LHDDNLLGLINLVNLSSCEKASAIDCHQVAIDCEVRGHDYLEVA